MEEEITSIVRQEETQCENFFSRPRERHSRGCGDGLVCERNTFKITDVVTGGDHTDISSGTT